MLCPFCQSPVEETTPACGGCGISIEQLDAMLGAAPAILDGITDSAGLFEKKERRRLLASMREFSNIFPQLRVSIATLNGIPEKLNLPAYTFWLFNRTDAVRKVETDGRNYDILFTVDAHSRRAALIVGYGLEPLVGKHHLAKVLQTGHDHLLTGRYAGGLLTMIDQLTTTLKEISAGVNTAFAIGAPPVAKAKTMAEAALDY
jgi:uncharacterized membrane protein YgcG